MLTKLLKTGLMVLCLPTVAWACGAPATFCTEPDDNHFAVIEKRKALTVVVESAANEAVQRAATSFAEDLSKLTGRKARVLRDPKSLKNAVVLIGELGHSPRIDELVVRGKLDVSAVVGKWEGFHIEVVANPWPKVPYALVVAGADRRGAIFGAYTLSEEMGVSPWYWFADVPVIEQTSLYISAGARSAKPGIRYRGFFINDEDPAFSGWATAKFGGVNAQAYERVFELLLRLKGNYLWPAMWSPKAFHLDDPENRVLADAMGVVMGTSHHEPLTLAQSEWHRGEDHSKTGGAWNYETNAENLRAFWRGGLERMMSKGDGEGYDNLLTVGMRGDGDAPMSEGTVIDLLEKIVSDQRQLITEVTGKPASEVPQVWALYKEVQDYYDKGMIVPDDVTLLFADDNWGQIRRLPTKDLQRQGGFGVYYHFDYVGVPRNYKWLNTVQIEKVWQQMDLAYQRGARNVWVVNVGDIKPMEYPLDFFMKMAWDPSRYSPQELQAFPKDWAQRWFGVEHAAAIAELITRYSQYAAFRKPELINENTFAIGQRSPEGLIPGEFYALVQRWRLLVQDLESVKKTLPSQYHSAFFQTVEHPILALSNLYELYFYSAWNQYLSRFHDARANYFLAKAKAAWQRDIDLTEQYHTMNGGKWQGMMNQVHMNYVHWNTPIEQSMPPLIYVAADTPMKERDKQPKFLQKPKSSLRNHSRAAASYDRAAHRASLRWETIHNLGQSGAAMVALPQGSAATSIADGVRLEYDIVIEQPGELIATLHLAPTLDTHGSDGLRIGVSLNDKPVKEVLYHLKPTAGAVESPEQREWVGAVINNGYELSISLGSVITPEQTLKIWRLDDNVVLEKLSWHIISPSD